MPALEGAESAEVRRGSGKRAASRRRYRPQLRAQ